MRRVVGLLVGLVAGACFGLASESVAAEGPSGLEYQALQASIEVVRLTALQAAQNAYQAADKVNLLKNVADDTNGWARAAGSEARQAKEQAAAALAKATEGAGTSYTAADNSWKILSTGATVQKIGQDTFNSLQGVSSAVNAAKTAATDAKGLAYTAADNSWKTLTAIENVARDQGVLGVAVDGVKTAVGQVKSAVDAVRTAVDGVQAGQVQVCDDVSTSAVLTGCVPSASRVAAGDAAQGTKLDAVKSAVDLVRTSVNGVKSSVDLVRAAVDGVKGAVTSAGLTPEDRASLARAGVPVCDDSEPVSAPWTALRGCIPSGAQAERHAAEEAERAEAAEAARARAEAAEAVRDQAAQGAVERAVEAVKVAGERAGRASDGVGEAVERVRVAVVPDETRLAEGLADARGRMARESQFGAWLTVAGETASAVQVSTCGGCKGPALVVGWPGHWETFYPAQTCDGTGARLAEASRSLLRVVLLVGTIGACLHVIMRALGFIGPIYAAQDKEDR